MKESEILVLVRARDLIRKIERHGGLSQAGEQSPNAIECIDTADDIDRLLPKRVLADSHYGCVGTCCSHKRKPKKSEKTTMPKVPKNWAVQPLKPGEKAKSKATCGTCNRSWDDGKVTSMTPAPSSRCPFEPFHPEEAL